MPHIYALERGLLPPPVTGGGTTMHDELFKLPAIVTRYRTGPYADAREQFLRQARDDGHPRRMLARIAWALPIVAEAIVHRENVNPKQLQYLIRERIRLRSSGRPPSAYSAALFLHFGEAWLRSIGVLMPENERPTKFASELRAFTEYMRVERGLSSTTIATREERSKAVHWRIIPSMFVITRFSHC
jgi:hypothetical protein